MTADEKTQLGILIGKVEGIHEGVNDTRTDVKVIGEQVTKNTMGIEQIKKTCVDTHKGKPEPTKKFQLFPFKMEGYNSQDVVRIVATGALIWILIHLLGLGGDLRQLRESVQLNGAGATLSEPEPAAGAVAVR